MFAPKIQEVNHTMSKLDKVTKAIEKGKEAALIKLAGDKDEEVKLAAIAGMGKIGKDDSFNIIVQSARRLCGSSG